MATNRASSSAECAAGLLAPVSVAESSPRSPGQRKAADALQLESDEHALENVLNSLNFVPVSEAGLDDMQRELDSLTKVTEHVHAAADEPSASATPCEESYRARMARKL